jgi:TatD DNase family protein
MGEVPRFALVDTHCHLDLSQFDEDREAVWRRAQAAGVCWLVIPGIDVHQCRKALHFAEGHPGVFVAVGVHPNSANEFDDRALGELRQLAQHPAVVAMGEIGLDFYWKIVPPQQQRQAFVLQLDLAAELGLPVIIHSRDANDDVAAVLRAWVGSQHFANSGLRQRPFAGVLHAFSGDLALAQEAYDWNFVLSLGGPVTFRNAQRLHALVPQLRLDRMMLETDSPYLTPHPYRGQRNEPSHVALVCEQLARLYGLTPTEVARDTTAVAARFFRVEDLFGANVPDRDPVAVP